MRKSLLLIIAFLLIAVASIPCNSATYKPLLLGNHWVVATGDPLGTTAGAMMYMKGGNAADAAASMMGCVAVAQQGVGWGGEAQILLYDPYQRKVIGINGMGVAPTGMTAEYFLNKGMAFPPTEGVDAATTPGLPGGLMTLVAEFGRLSLAEVLEPVISMADGWALPQSMANSYNSKNYDAYFGTPGKPGDWKYSAPVYRPNGLPLVAGAIFQQRELATTLRKLVATEQQALANGASRKEAIYAAYDRFYKGDIAEEFVRGSQEGGGLHTLEDLANWTCYIEEPRTVNYHGIDVYKLAEWTQGPVLLQMLNILEGFDLESMGLNSVEYIHTIYQTMNLAYADRDFYYGDPYMPPKEPMEGLLSKEYAAERRKLIDPNHNNPNIGPGDPYPYQGEENPYLDWAKKKWANLEIGEKVAFIEDDWRLGTTSVQAADIEGWVVSVTPSGAWVPGYNAGHTGVPMSQRAQSFVCDPELNPFNVVEPGKRPRVTLTPSLALKDGRPFMSFSLPGGDTQDQALLQLFLMVVHFGMNIQEACEAPKFVSYQMESSFSSHSKSPGRIMLDTRIPQEVFDQLVKMGYDVNYSTSDYSGTIGLNPQPLTAIMFNHDKGTLEGGASIGRYGIAW